MVKLNEYVPIADDRRLVVLPNIPEGEYAQSWADVYNREVQERFEGNANLIPSDDFSGMNFFKALLVDEIAKREYKGAVRVSLPRDLDSKVVAMVKDRFYTIPRALAFRDTSEIWERNKPIADELAGHIEHAHGRMPKYAMIQGLVVNPWPDNTQGYQLMVVPVEREFRVIEDDRLSPEFNGLYFSQIDKDGLPVDLTEEQGDKTQRWFTSNQRLSWFVLDRYSTPATATWRVLSGVVGWFFLVAKPRALKS